MAQVLLIIAFQGFRDEEYLEPKTVLEQAGHKVVTASTQLGTAQGKIKATAQVDLTLDQVKINDYAAIAFIGGPGSYDYFNNKTALKLAQDAAKAGKVVGAICAAAGTLAHAGVLKSVKATSFPDVAEILKEKGANYTGAGLEVSGKIITADGPAQARGFGQALAAGIA